MSKLFMLVSKLIMMPTPTTKVTALRYTERPHSLTIILQLMTACGVYAPPRPESPSRQEKVMHTVKLAWFSATLLATVLNVARLLPAFGTGGSVTLDEVLFLKTVIIFWYTQCALNMLVMAYACNCSSCLPRLLMLWDEVFHGGQVNAGRTLSRLARAAAVLYAAFVAANVVLISYILFSGDENMDKFTVVLYSPLGHSVPLQVWLVVLQAYLAGTWILPIVLYGCVCLVTTMFVDDTMQQLVDQIDTKTKVLVGGDMERHRLRFEAVCTMVETADSTFSFFVVLCLCTDIPLMCTIIYMTIWPETLSTYIIIFNVFMLMITVFHMAVVMWPATHLNAQAHGSVGKLYSISTRSLSEHDKYELMLFVNRLQGPPIGITAWKIFTIDRNSLLMILSVLLTYFVVLIQMRVPPSAHPASSTSANLTS